MRRVRDGSIKNHTLWCASVSLGLFWVRGTGVVTTASPICKQTPHTLSPSLAGEGLPAYLTKEEQSLGTSPGLLIGLPLAVVQHRSVQLDPLSHQWRERDRDREQRKRERERERESSRPMYVS